MIVFRPSADFARKLKLSSPLPDLPFPENPLFDWCVRPFRFGRYGFVLFTHTTTLFTLLTLQRGITTPKALRRAFAHAVNDYRNEVPRKPVPSSPA